MSLHPSFPGNLRRIVLVCLALALPTGLASAADLQPFTPESLQEIRRTNAGRPFILVFWSIHCAPCKEEMPVLAELQRKFPQVPIVLVAADPPDQKPALVRFLAAYNLGGIETWQFADDFAERIRHAVDRSWRGELPRTYFFNGAHEVEGHSGLLDQDAAVAWLERETAAAQE